MIYLDNAATTKPDGEILKKNADLYDENFFNPSALYRGGLDVKSRIESAREKINAYFNKNYETVFTSCGSEADNTVILPYAKRGNIVTTAGEHSAVYETFKALKARGADVRFAPIDKCGRVIKEKLLDLIDQKTSLVTVVHVNNETGGINDINDLAKAVKAKNPSTIFHSDGVQSFGKLPYRIDLSVDAYLVSAHKINGVKGVGALIRKKTLTLPPLIFGGGQEFNLRSGTENAFGIAVFGDAAEEKRLKIQDNYLKICEIKNKFLNSLDFKNIKLISDENCSPYVISLSAEGLRGEVVQHMLEEFGIIIGTGSACSSRHRHSRVLQECGYSDKVLDGALRISFCSATTEQDALFCAEKLNECVKKLKGVMYK